MTTDQQISLIVSKFTEVRAAIGNHTLPQGAKPSISDMWAMATALIIKDMAKDVNVSGPNPSGKEDQCQ